MLVGGRQQQNNIKIGRKSRSKIGSFVDEEESGVRKIARSNARLCCFISFNTFLLGFS
jgi:hypothetical protein